MALFEKREMAFQVVGDHGRWRAAKAVLKDAGVKVVDSGYYDTEPPLCSCGPKLDHRDFGPLGKIDRHTYYIAVRSADLAQAQELLKPI